MAIENLIRKISYLCTGVTTVFPVPFEYSRTEDIHLLLTDAAGVETEISTGFQVNVNGAGDTSVRYPLSGSPLPAGQKLTLYRDTPQTQIVDLIYGGAFSPDVLEHDGFDRLEMQIQELQEEVDRAIIFPLSHAGDVPLAPEFINSMDDKIAAAAAQADRSQGEADRAQNMADDAAASRDTAISYGNQAIAAAASAGVAAAGAASSACAASSSAAAAAQAEQNLEEAVDASAASAAAAAAAEHDATASAAAAAASATAAAASAESANDDALAAGASASAASDSEESAGQDAQAAAASATAANASQQEAWSILQEMLSKQGVATYLEGHDFGDPTADANWQQTLTDHALSHLGGTTVPNATFFINQWDGHEWVYSTVQELWVDYGLAAIGQATNSTLGSIKGDAVTPGALRMNSDGTGKINPAAAGVPGGVYPADATMTLTAAGGIRTRSGGGATASANGTTGIVSLAADTADLTDRAHAATPAMVNNVAFPRTPTVGAVILDFDDLLAGGTYNITTGTYANAANSPVSAYVNVQKQVTRGLLLVFGDNGTPGLLYNIRYQIFIPNNTSAPLALRGDSSRSATPDFSPWLLLRDPPATSATATANGALGPTILAADNASSTARNIAVTPAGLAASAFSKDNGYMASANDFDSYTESRTIAISSTAFANSANSPKSLYAGTGVTYGTLIIFGDSKNNINRRTQLFIPGNASAPPAVRWDDSLSATPSFDPWYLLGSTPDNATAATATGYGAYGLARYAADDAAATVRNAAVTPAGLAAAMAAKVPSSGAAPKPIATAGVGQWVQPNVVTHYSPGSITPIFSLALPTGGTWAFVCKNAVGIAAGGTTIMSVESQYGNSGLAWRIA